MKGVTIFRVLLVLSFGVFAMKASAKEPVEVSPCQLQYDRATYNHQLVRVTGFVSQGFEDFTLSDPECGTRYTIWLEYGGTTKSGTMYCCGVTNDRSRSREMKVEGIPVSLVKDETFDRFDALIQDRGYKVVHASLIGRFFAGRKQSYGGGDFWGGYGHMGCCSLLVVQQVASFGPHDRQDLDYSSDSDQPLLSKVGCGYRDLWPLSPFKESIASQRRAENQHLDWMFTDPQRIAKEALARLATRDPSPVSPVQKSSTSSRFIYEWLAKDASGTYRVVVSRPYWLSFYAKDSNRVALVVIGAYQLFCDPKSNTDKGSTIRIK